MNGLIVTANVNGFSGIPTYHRIYFGPWDFNKGKLQIIVQVFSTKAYADTNPGDYITLEKINIDGDAYTTYFSGATFTNGSPNFPLAQAYQFLKDKVKPEADMTEEEKNDKTFYKSRFDYTTATDA